jgi:hypothetical protein
VEGKTCYCLFLLDHLTVTLYLTGRSPVIVDKLKSPEIVNGFANVPDQVPTLLGCLPGLVDVLAIGPGYVVYSVFDSE